MTKYRTRRRLLYVEFCAVSFCSDQQCTSTFSLCTAGQLIWSAVWKAGNKIVQLQCRLIQRMCDWRPAEMHRAESMALLACVCLKFVIDKYLCYGLLDFSTLHYPRFVTSLSCVSLAGAVEQYWFSVGLSMSCSCCGDAGKQWTTEVLCWSYW